MAHYHGLIGCLLVVIFTIQQQCQAKLRTTNALLDFGVQPPHTSERNKREIGAKQVADLDGIAVQQLKLLDNVLWTTEITLGGQQFTVIVDTGSSDLWLASVDCTSPKCLERRRYDPAKSARYSRPPAPDHNKTIQVLYGGDVQLYGLEARDTLEIGGLRIESQSFLMVHQIMGAGWQRLKVDGLLGLGYMALSRMGARTPFEQMLDQKLIKQPVFSIAPTGYKSKRGQLTFGSPGQGYQASEFKNAKLLQARYWQFALQGVSLERETPNSVRASVLYEVCVGHVRCNAIADSGAALIIGSSREVREINGQLGAIELGGGIFKFADCSVIQSLPNLVFTFNNGDKLALTPEMYTIKRDDHCLSGLALQPANKFPFWILGTTFVNNFNTLYDYKGKRVGFAPLH